MRIRAPHGVYRPRSDTELLIRTLQQHPLREHSRVLELCTGTGVVALALAAMHHDVVAVDLSRRAVWSARYNARVNRLPIDVRRGNLFAPVAGERFDAIVVNPPYVPAPDSERASTKNRAWNAGRDGRALLDPICDRVGDFLRDDGIVYIMQSSLAGVEQTKNRLSARGLEPSVLASVRGPLGPIAAERLDFLRANGRIEGRSEDLVVISASCVRSSGRSDQSLGGQVPADGAQVRSAGRR